MLTCPLTNTERSKTYCSKNMPNASETQYELSPHWTNETTWESFLETDELTVFRNQIGNIVTTLRLTGSVSFVASMCLVTHILRSYEGLKSTYHRLVFGLSIYDIMSSLGYALSSAMVPKEMNPFTPGAIGNWSTCSAQGFMIGVGTCGTGLYNCSICLYYLAVIKYNKKDTYIRKTLEPLFHGLAITIPIVYGSLVLSVNAFTPLIGFCFITNPDVKDMINPHCWFYADGETPEGFTKPCGHGSFEDHPIIYILAIQVLSAGTTLILTPVTISVAMTLMYICVVRVEKNIMKYGVNALRLRVRESQIIVPIVNTNRTEVEEYESNGQVNILAAWLKELCSRSCRRRKRTSNRKNKVRSKKRAILQMAAGYGGAWLIIFVPYIILAFTHVAYETALITAALTPLQGLFNFLIFMSPIVRSVKNPPRKRRAQCAASKKITWFQAFSKAYLSRGERINNMRGMQRTRNSQLLATTKALRSFVRGVMITLRSTIPSSQGTSQSHTPYHNQEQPGTMTTDEV